MSEELKQAPATGDIQDALENNFREFDNPDATDANVTADDFVRSLFEGDEPDKDEPDKDEPDKDEPDKDEPDKDEPDEPDKDEPDKDEPDKDEPDKDDDDEPGSDDKRTRDWRNLKAAKKEADKLAADMKAKVGTLEKTIAELQSKVANLPELEEKAKFIEEAERELAISRVEGTREYKTTIEAPIKAIESAMDAIAKETGVGLDKIFAAIEEPDPAKRRAALKEVTADMDDVDRQDVMQAARDAQVLLARKAEIHAQAAEAAKESKAAQEAKAAEDARRAKAAFSEAADAALDKLRERVDFKALVPEGQDIDDYAASVRAKIDESGYDDASIGTKAYSVAAGVLLPKVNAKLNEALKEVKTLKARVKELTSKGAAPADLGTVDEPDETTGNPFDDVAAALRTPGITRGSVLDVLSSVGK